MEFYNERLLPNGLPEIIAQMVPHDIYLCTKVISHRRKWMKPGKTSLGVQGHAYYDNLTESFCIGLYPIACCHHALVSRLAYSGKYPGTTSFQLWMAMLDLALHEIGHLAMGHTSKDNLYRYGHSYYSTLKREAQADRWRDHALARILRVSPRLGQPPGHLTGYAGVLAHLVRQREMNTTGKCDQYVLDELRAMKCDAQVPLREIIVRLADWRSFYDYCEQHGIDAASRPLQRVRLLDCYRRRIRADVHTVAKQMGITRYAPSKHPGYEFLMFNAAEAQAVSSALRGRQWPIGPR